MTDATRLRASAPPAAVLVVLLLLAIACALALPATGQAPGETPGQAPEQAPADPPAGPANPALQYFTNVELVNQYGEPMRLYSDLLEGKIVLINTMFTHCTGICPVMSKSIEKIQEHVGDRVGRDVHLISVSVDPERDTPERMREWADKFHARRGWYFVTGSKENVAFALQKLGQYVEDPETHQGVMIMGNEPTGLWKKAFGLAGADQLIEVFDTVLQDTGAGAGS